LLSVESSFKKAFGKVLLDLRTEKEVSQQEVADHCDIERAYISRLERGLFQPTITIIFKLADYFGISPAELIQKVDATRKKRKS
jgi:transcriptional regulator with XRE-family HTH domain